MMDRYRKIDTDIAHERETEANWELHIYCIALWGCDPLLPSLLPPVCSESLGFALDFEV